MVCKLLHKRELVPLKLSHGSILGSCNSSRWKWKPDFGLTRLCNNTKHSSDREKKKKTSPAEGHNNKNILTVLIPDDNLPWSWSWMSVAALDRTSSGVSISHRSILHTHTQTHRDPPGGKKSIERELYFFVYSNSRITRLLRHDTESQLMMRMKGNEKFLTVCVRTALVGEAKNRQGI